MRWARTEGLVHEPDRQLGICDHCGHVYPADDLTWTVEDWVATDGRRGHETGTLCRDCSELALEHCWRCGRLTSAPDGDCGVCEVER